MRRQQSPPPSLQAYINKVQDESTTNIQLKHALHDDVDIVPYTELASIGHIRELFQRTNNVVILFPTAGLTIGHYILLMYYPDTEIYSLFDPYGYSLEVDISLAVYLRKFDNRVKQALPRLLHGNNVLVNYYPVQSRADESIKTCGKHCVARVLFRDIIDHEAYYKFLKFEKLTRDQIVSLMFL